MADPATGVPVYVTMTIGDTAQSMWLKVGGTSLSAPIWGAITVSADQLRAAAGKPHLASNGPDGDTAHTGVYATAAPCGTSPPAPTAAAAPSARPDPATTPSPASAHPQRVSTRHWRP
ncbi:hypothetical protein [Streptomyces sp. IBSBF 3136]|uniref:hypothetical protein n=1 Tax=Streptomyces sp. IBSBF 3136 TaxID=2903524 RepID=UPI002FDC43DD